MNSVVLIGRLTKDPELAFVPATGLAVVKINLAVDKELFGEKKQQAISQGKPTADFINITVFGKMAESCTNFLAKGRECAVHGRINTGSYTTQTGEKRYTTDVIADRVEFIGSKNEGQAKPQGGSFPSEDEDIFTPVDPEDVPF
ncbi:single-stranded DNA-binding protein [Sedimentibacter sp.]|uniref:single-stranded DNA-binding protein n=1 Tax=Sedimentibacter sp. TaxID=1960295 RepID=UPI0028AF3F88|nr:single-stranded DNA-binding protein [Sedimentibacter sp.]